MSKLSFQYGFRVFLITLVDLVCSPPMVATANGSGNPIEGHISGRIMYKREIHTEDIPFVEPVSSNYLMLLLATHNPLLMFEGHTGDPQVGGSACKLASPVTEPVVFGTH